MRNPGYPTCDGKGSHLGSMWRSISSQQSPPSTALAELQDNLDLIGAQRFAQKPLIKTLFVFCTDVLIHTAASARWNGCPPSRNRFNGFPIVVHPQCSPCLRGDRTAENHFTTKTRRTLRTACEVKLGHYPRDQVLAKRRPYHL